MCVFGVPHLAVLRHLVSSDASCEMRKKIIDPSSEKKFHEATMVYYNVLIHLRGPNALTNFTPPQRDSPSPSSLPVVAETLAEVCEMKVLVIEEDFGSGYDSSEYHCFPSSTSLLHIFRLLSVEKEESLRKRAWEESKKMWVVAGPAIFTRFSTFGIMVVSQSFIGHIGSTELAAYAIVMTVLV
ncbi:Protein DETOXIFICATION 21, partial [Glycine soja]